MDALRGELIKDILSYSKDLAQGDWITKIFWSLVKGGITEDPFPSALLEKMRYLEAGATARWAASTCRAPIGSAAVRASPPLPGGTS